MCHVVLEADFGNKWGCARSREQAACFPVPWGWSAQPSPPHPTHSTFLPLARGLFPWGLSGQTWLKLNVGEHSDFCTAPTPQGRAVLLKMARCLQGCCSFFQHLQSPRFYKSALGELRTNQFLSKMEINAIITKMKVFFCYVFCVSTHPSWGSGSKATRT